jgi:hypothetical protein
MRLFRKVRGATHAAHDLRAAHAETGASVASMLRDLVSLNVKQKLGVRAYFNYRLFDPQITAAQKTEYLPIPTGVSSGSGAPSTRSSTGSPSTTS